MPTYVYECSSCNKTFEVEQRIIEDPLKDCQCGSKGSLKRVIQPVGIAFRGSGFHINDYSSKPADSKSMETKPAETAPAESTASSCTGQPATCPACSPDKVA